MGFLNHATNNIIIDAVLTERGRELLSRNNGEFNISTFSFGDDEVDYSLINKYGLTIGKEKIEKNTPIFEANPNENIALKHPLVSFSNLTTIREIPKIIRKDANTAILELLSVVSGAASANTIELPLKTTLINSNITQIDTNLQDSRFLVKAHKSLINISNGTLIDTDINLVSTYYINTTQPTASDFTNQVEATLNFYSAGYVLDSAFTEFGSISNVNEIFTQIQIIGESSGSSLIIPVKIKRGSSDAE